MDANIIFNTASNHLPIYSDFKGKIINNWFEINKINKNWNNYGKKNIKLYIKIFNNKIYKFSNSIENSFNTIICSAIYRFFNIKTIRYNLLQINNGFLIESNFMERYNELSNINEININIYNKIIEGFFIDVLLLNYDIINDVCENIGIYNDFLIRQDINGSMLFRAMGSKRTKNELLETQSHISILGKEINKGIFKGFCRDKILNKALSIQKKEIIKN